MTCSHRHLLPAYDWSRKGPRQLIAQCADCPKQFSKRDVAQELGLLIDESQGHDIISNSYHTSPARSDAGIGPVHH